MPGVEVDKDGNVKSQGNRYKKYMLTAKNFLAMIQISDKESHCRYGREHTGI